MLRVSVSLPTPSRMAAARAECDRLNDLVGNVVAVFVPDGGDTLGFFLIAEMDSTGDIDAAAAHLADELRRIILHLGSAIEELTEGGGR